MRSLFVIFFFFQCVASLAQLNPTEPIVIGEKITIHSYILSEDRSLNIYLPPEYDENKNGKFPVVYLLDGGMDEDFIHITGLYQYNSFPWIKRVSPSIIIGILNKDRMRDMTSETKVTSLKKAYPFSGHSSKFMDFIQKELQPFVEKNYRTNKSKTIIGQSLAGLVATEILLKRPTLFNHYMIISPSLWWDDGSLLNIHSKILDSNFHQSTNVFIAVGKEGLTPGENPHVMEVDANLLAEKISGSKSHFVKTCFDYLPFEDHATVFHQAIYDALKTDSSCNYK